jgi:hypothetical protein
MSLDQYKRPRLKDKLAGNIKPAINQEKKVKVEKKKSKKKC